MEINVLTRQVEEEGNKDEAVMRLQTHPGVGPVTALAMVLTLGPAERFAAAKHGGQLLRTYPQRA